MTREELYKNILSFDIETTGLNKDSNFGVNVNGVTTRDIKPRVWSMAVHNKNTNNSHARIFDSPDMAKEAAALKSNRFYGKNDEWNKYASGKYKSLEAYDGQARSFNKMIEESKFKRGMMLIQNARFERHWMASIADESSERMGMFDKLRYMPVDPSNNTRLFTPPSITNLKNSINYDTMTPKEIDSIHDKIMNTYEKELREVMGAKEDKIIVGDLMDFTAATFNKAVVQGHLPKDFQKKGHNIEVLAQVFLGEKELHSAESDSIQQSKIFDEMVALRERMQTGTMTPKDTRRLQFLASQKNNILELATSRGILGLSESIIEGQPNLSGGILGKGTMQTIDTETGAKIDIITNRYMKGDNLENSVNAYISAIDKSSSTQSYKLLSETVDNNTFEEASKYMMSKEYMAKIEGYRQQAQDAFDEGIRGLNAGEEVPNTKIKQPGVIDKASTLFESYSEKYSEALDRDEILKKIMPESPKKGLALIAGIAGTGALWVAANGNSEDRAQRFRDRKKKQEASSYNDAVFEMYKPIEKPQSYVGTMKANWDERNQHYYY